MRLVGLLDERNVVEWSALGVEFLSAGQNNIRVSCLCVIVGAILSISFVLTCGRCVLLMVWRLSSRVPCGRFGFFPCCVLC